MNKYYERLKKMPIVGGERPNYEPKTPMSQLRSKWDTIYGRDKWRDIPLLQLMIETAEWEMENERKR